MDCEDWKKGDTPDVIRSKAIVLIKNGLAIPVKKSESELTDTIAIVEGEKEIANQKSGSSGTTVIINEPEKGKKFNRRSQKNKSV